MSHSTVSTPNTKGTVSVDPSVARTTLRSSTRHRAQFFSGPPDPGFCPSAIVPNITQRVSRLWCVRCTAPAKRYNTLYMYNKRARRITQLVNLSIDHSIGRTRSWRSCNKNVFKSTPGPRYGRRTPLLAVCSFNAPHLSARARCWAESVMYMLHVS